jgi:coenzyme F420-reducing hydrogenase beta subunit
MITVFGKSEDCCGCTACYNICSIQAITMKLDDEGFLYPIIDKELCIDCGMCKEVCAFQNGYNTFNNIDKPEVYAIKHRSNKVRENSSSGGAFTAISDCMLLKNGVLYGVTYDDEFRVIHQREETAEGRNKLRGSKYVQSDLKKIFKKVKEDLVNGRNVLFTGTGCQVAGLNSYLEKLKVDTKKLLTVDIICHGVPSPRIFAEYISYLEKKNKGKIEQYYFRSKVYGWGYTEEVVYKNRKSDHTSALLQVYKELFYSNLCLRPSCYRCKYTNFLRPADITIGDYWGIENYFPEFADSLGVSAMIINTKKGKASFSELKENIEIIPSNIYDCAARQRNLYSPTPISLRRSEFWNDYLQYGFEYIIKKYTTYGFKGKIKKYSVFLFRKLGLLKLVRKAPKKG